MRWLAGIGPSVYLSIPGYTQRVRVGGERMRLFLRLAAPLAALLLAGCETVAGPATTPATALDEPAPRSTLPDTTYGTVQPVPGVRYLALNLEARSLVLGELNAYLRVWQSATFGEFIAAEVQPSIIVVCGTLSASDGSSRRSGAPFVAMMSYDDDLRVALMYGLDGSVARAGAPLVYTDPAVIRGFCREQIGAVLPGTARPSGATTIPPLLPRLR